MSADTREFEDDWAERMNAKARDPKASAAAWQKLKVGVDAERMWFVTRLKRFRTDWMTFGRKQPVSDYDQGYRDACANCAGALDALIAERER